MDFDYTFSVMNMNTIIADTPKDINAFRLLTLRSALKLEILGMRPSSMRRTASSIIKAEFGFKGNKQSVLNQFTDYLKAQNILVA